METHLLTLEDEERCSFDVASVLGTELHLNWFHASTSPEVRALRETCFDLVPHPCTASCNGLIHYWMG